MTISEQLDLTYIEHPVMREQALKAWAEGDIGGVLISMDNELGLYFVRDNMITLIRAGLYEIALLRAYAICRTNWHSSPRYLMPLLFNAADRKKLIAAGSPLPGNAPFVVYRGVAGVGAKRRVRGVSWTADFEKAKWFATRYEHLDKPAVFKAVVPLENVYAYYDERQEKEFLCNIPDDIKLERYDISTK